MDYAAALGELLDRDPVRSRIVAMVSSLRLPDCWIGAGFLRNAVWDHLHGRVVSAPVEDIDVIWFDPARADAATDAALERGLRGLDPPGLFNAAGWAVLRPLCCIQGAK